MNVRPETILLASAAFLAPIIGGQVPREATAIEGSVLTEAFGGPALPLMTRLLIGGLILGGLIILFVKRRVVQTPAPAISISFFAALTGLGLSIAQSDFKSVSLIAWLTWFVYFVAFFLTISAVGRRLGVRLVLTALLAGASIAAFKGILEYAEIMRQEPTYRIFAGWSNPNAIAGMLLVVVPIGMAVTASLRGPARALAGLGTGLTVVALGLTQSKGGFLALAVGLAAFAVLFLAWKVKRREWMAFVPLLIGAACFFGLQAVASSGTTGGSALTRVAAGGEQEQSAGFRKLLWQGTTALAKDHPLGTGIGTYRFHSAEPGLTEQTMYSHQTFLQLGAEAGILTAAAILIGIGVIIGKSFRGARSMPSDRNVLRAGVIAAILAAGTHALVESNAYYLGIGLSVFILLGILVQLSSDSSSPELLPPSLRLSIALIGGLIPLVFLAQHSKIEFQKAAFLSAASSPSRLTPEMVERLPGDPEGLFLRAMYGAANPEERLALLLESADGAPTTRTLRALSRAAVQVPGQEATATVALERALAYDPLNLNTLKQAMENSIQRQDEASAEEWARRLLAVESTPYFQVRALPDFVPTETYEARLYLASKSDDTEEIEELLKGAIDGFARYRDRTLPQIKRFASAGEPAPGGESLSEATAKMQTAASAARELAKIYSTSGRDSEAVGATEAAVEFEEAASGASTLK